MTEKPNRHTWEEDSTHRSVAGYEYDEVWDYAEQLEAENERLREALNLIATHGADQNSSNFDNYWYSEYAYFTAEKALGGE